LKKLAFYGQLRELAHPANFHDLVSALAHLDCVAYAKPPFGGPDQVLRYLARYTHCVGISNGRLLALEEGRVRFRWRDSQNAAWEWRCRARAQIQNRGAGRMRVSSGSRKRLANFDPC
jgi:hypothetical protein